MNPIIAPCAALSGPRPNKPGNVSPDTASRQSPNKQSHERKPITQPDKEQAKRVDISHLRHIADEHSRVKKEVESKMGNIKMLRMCTFLLALIVIPAGKYLCLAIFPDMPEGAVTPWIFGLVLGIVTMVALMFYVNRSHKAVTRRQEDNDRRYATQYSCPECHRSFANQYYETLLAEGKCPACKTEFYEA